MESPKPKPPSASAGSSTRRAFRRLARRGRRYALPWLSIGRWHKRLLLGGAALLAGLICIAFAIGAELAIGTHASIMHERPWLTLFVAPAGFAFLAWISRKFFPATEGSGIPQAIAASLSEDGNVRKQFLSLRIALAKVVLTLDN